ncbi:MAG: GerMN domain-containing protein [Clostridiales bacterium]|jgi:germination protein M|nr:GerMN domain-containing protein [Clostridiales bacterium]
MRKAIFFIGLLLVLTPLLNGCSFWEKKTTEPVPQQEDRLPQKDSQLRETVFYFPDSSWRVIVPVRYNIPWQEGIARATLGYTEEGQVPLAIAALGLAPLLPAGTEVLGMTIRDGLARVDFNRTFLNYDVNNERNYIYGLVFTLTEFPTVNRVEFLVEGNNLGTLPGGMAASEPFSRYNGLNLEIAEEAQDAAQTERITLYYLYQTTQDAFYVPVTRVIGKTGQVVDRTVEELITGPAPGSPLFSAIPRSVALENVTVTGGKVTIRMAGDFSTAVGGQVAADQIRDQLALTLTEIPGVMEIEVLVRDKAPQFAAGVSFPSSFSRPKNWNYVPTRENLDTLQ